MCQTEKNKQHNAFKSQICQTEKRTALHLNLKYVKLKKQPHRVQRVITQKAIYVRVY